MSFDARSVRQMRQRMEAIAWFRDVLQRHPGGFVPVSTASRILGHNSTHRLWRLIKEGRITLIKGMPGGTHRDVFVPIDELMTAPFLAEAGRKGFFGTDRKKFREPRKKYGDDNP